MYVTNNHAIVQHAKRCYKEYPTIVNNIPKEKNHYNNTLEDYAVIDNRLGSSQMAIGQSSNLAQISLSYGYNFNNSEYKDTCCILSVLAQVAIDNAKRSFDIDLTDEIDRIKGELGIDMIAYPKFWKLIKTKQAKKSKYNKNKDHKIKVVVNEDLVCPMNILYDFKPKQKHSSSPTLPNEMFFIKYELKEDRRTCKKVEDLIQKYSWDLYKYNTGEEELEDYWMIEDQFKQLIKDIKAIHISNNYLGLMSYLIDRGLNITAAQRGKKNVSSSKLYKNQALLLKTLYTVNPKQFLQCWSKNVYNEQKIAI